MSGTVDHRAKSHRNGTRRCAVRLGAADSVGFPMGLAAPPVTGRRHCGALRANPRRHCWNSGSQREDEALPRMRSTGHVSADRTSRRPRQPSVRGSEGILTFFPKPNEPALSDAPVSLAPQTARTSRHPALKARGDRALQQSGAARLSDSRHRTIARVALVCSHIIHTAQECVEQSRADSCARLPRYCSFSRVKYDISCGGHCHLKR